MLAFIPTDEQTNIVEAVNQYTKLKIEARAGSGKSSTLALIAEYNPCQSLYLTFNKNMATEAQNKFPPYVEVRTTHSLAYGVTGRLIAHKLVRPTGGYKNVCGTGAEIAKYYRIAPFVVTPEKSISGTAMGYAVKSTLAKFEYSSEREVLEKHVSFFEAEKVITNPKFNKREYAARVLKYAQKLWKERIDPKSIIQATHDTYLKMFQLTNPDLSAYEIIYLDEGHDSSACLLDIILKQKGRVVLVGDTYQSIYQWRGAVNAMEKTKWETRYLTKSFRFGQSVADIAQSILLDEHGRKHIQIQGYEKLNTQVSGVIEGSKYTWLFRTNSALIAEAVDLVSAGKNININVDINDFKSLLMSALALRSGNMKGVKHHDLISFDSWKEFEEDIEISKRAELKRIYKYIKDGKAGSMLEILNTYKPHHNPDIILTTVHKAKGLEWDIVVLAEDFPEFEIGMDGEWEGWHEQERNLLYVAVTRAKKVLVINGVISQLLAYLAEIELEDSSVGNLIIGNLSVVKHQNSSSQEYDLNNLVKCKIAGDFGVIINELDEFIEGDEKVANEVDEIGDLVNPDHWMNIRPHG